MPKLDTKLVRCGHEASQHHGFVSPPVYRGSTVLYSSVAELEDCAQDKLKLRGPCYGRFGNPNSRDFESALTALEGGFGTVTTGTGLSALTTAVLSFVKSGDHILIADSVYFPTRRFCSSLSKFGVTTEYYDPLIGRAIADRFQENTRLVLMESPGSLTFEIQDVAAISDACRRKNIISLIDNTWATPLYFQPLKHGVNISIHSATKYITGHADSFLGAIICDEMSFEAVRSTSIDLGQKAGADDVCAGLRGLKTLSVRMSRHDQNARGLAGWLEGRREVRRVLHPALNSHPQHHLWRRDFKGAGGLFSVELHDYPKHEVDAFIDALELFGLGHSWGGYESLLVPVPAQDYRLSLQVSLADGGKTDPQRPGAPRLRIHAGLEDVGDLKADLAQAFRIFKNS